RPALHMGLLFALGGLLGLGLACVQLIPMLEFFPESNRTPNPSLIDQANGSFDLSGLLGLAMPDPFGHPNLTAELEYGRSPLTFWLFNLHTWADGVQASVPLLPKYNYIEYTIFPGTLVLLLALAGLLTRGPPMRWFAAGTILLLVTLACGPSFLKFLYQHVPPINQIPPMRFIGPVAMLIATLAAIGLHNILTLTRRCWIGVWVVSLSLALFFFTAWLWIRAQDPTQLVEHMSAEIAAHYKTSLDAPNITAEIVKRELTQEGVSRARHVVGHQLLASNLLYAAIAMALASIWWALHGFGQAQRWRIGLSLIAIIATTTQLLPLAHGVSGGREMPFPHDTPVHTFLRQQRDAHHTDGGFTVARASNPGGQLAIQLPPDTLVPERIRDLNIYTFTDARAHLPFQELYGPTQLIRGFWVNALPDDERLKLPFMDLLGLRYILSTTPLEHAGRRTGPELKGPGGEFFIYERDSALPRAIVVPRLDVKPDETAVIEALLGPDLEPRAAALITQAQRQELEQQLGSPPAPGGKLAGQRSVRFLRDHPCDLQLDVDAGEAGYLVLNDTFMPGWSATVNGQPAAMARANLNRRVVPLPAEHSMVEMHYTTPGLLLGAMITLLSFFIAACIGVMGRANTHPTAATRI
ncbi:MAG: hypothetical protein QF412_10535, partial [Planctomycetota bacterium]|nr:hypothetical protein [Planctomycetota bacterium]